jgi:hypothetical protein
MPYNSKLELTRTLGFEIECFVDHQFYDDDDDYHELDIIHSEVGSDGSLYGGDGDECEVKTMPIKNLNKVEEVYSDLDNYSMNVNSTCGLHIHVDNSDFTVHDKARLLRFGAGIELLMFSLVEPERFYGRNNQGQNEYCTKLHKGWRKIFRPSFIKQSNIPWNTFGGVSELEQYVRRNSSHSDSQIWNGRYQWLNARVSHAPTVEFRIFSATEDYKQAQKFGMLAYHVVETVKNSTLDQLHFIIKSIYQATSLDEMFNRFFDSIGLDQEFRPEILNDRLAERLETKYCQVNREQLVSGDESQAV